MVQQSHQRLQHDRLPLEFALTYAELSEAFEAARKAPEHLGEELADVLIVLVSIAEMTDIDIESAIKAKIAKNATRTYRKLDNGVMMKAFGPHTVDQESQ